MTNNSRTFPWPQNPPDNYETVSMTRTDARSLCDVISTYNDTPADFDPLLYAIDQAQSDASSSIGKAYLLIEIKND